MNSEKLIVTISKTRENHKEICEKVEEIVKEINERNGFINLPYLENDSVYQFTYFGTMSDGVACMAAGAMMVGR